MSQEGISREEAPKLKAMECIMIAVGGMMGSSIFTLSGVTYALAGPSAMVSWALAGIVLLLYAMSLAELATTFQTSGGIFVYPYMVLGKTEKQKLFWGWISAWSWLNVSVLGIAFSAISVATYLQEFLPVIKENQMLYFAIPTLWILMCFLLNALKTSFLGKINGALTLVLILICVLYILSSFGKIDLANYQPFFSGTMGGRGTIAAIPIAMLAYGSIIAIASIAGEIENGKQMIPKIMSSSVFLTIAVYVLILASTFGMAPVTDFLAYPERQYFPLVYALMRSTGGKSSLLVSIIPIGAVLAISTTILVLIMDSSRTIAALASKRLLPRYFAKINHKTGTPLRALGLVSLLAILLTLRPHFIWLMISTGSVACAITVVFIALTQIALRRQRKELYVKEAYHTPGGILFPALTILLVFVTLLLLYFGEGGKMTYILSLGWYGLGLIIFLSQMIFKDLSKKKSLSHVKH